MHKKVRFLLASGRAIVEVSILIVLYLRLIYIYIYCQILSWRIGRITTRVTVATKGAIDGNRFSEKHEFPGLNLKYARRYAEALGVLEILIVI